MKQNDQHSGFETGSDRVQEDTVKQTTFVVDTRFIPPW